MEKSEEKYAGNRNPYPMYGRDRPALPPDYDNRPFRSLLKLLGEIDVRNKPEKEPEKKTVPKRPRNGKMRIEGL